MSGLPTGICEVGIFYLNLGILAFFVLACPFTVLRIGKFLPGHIKIYGCDKTLIYSFRLNRYRFVRQEE